MKERANRLWLPQNRGIQATMCLCEKCGEAYEADRAHVCRKENSYPYRFEEDNDTCRKPLP